MNVFRAFDLGVFTPRLPFTPQPGTEPYELRRFPSYPPRLQVLPEPEVRRQPKFVWIGVKGNGRSGPGEEIAYLLLVLSGLAAIIASFIRVLTN